ncbi:MAG: glutathione peroxidase [Bacteroidales bacterium]|nr:glutathione peroxidase [Bacteroidales bacterium]
MKKIIMTLVMAATFLAATAQQSIYDITVVDGVGQNVALSTYRGKVLLIVNTATKCGFTPQYTELQKLYEDYAEKGLEVLDFPCNQFGEQAPGSNEEIHEFCTSRYSITFPQFEKIDVNGDNASPLFTFLKSKKGFDGFDKKDRTGKMMHVMLKAKDKDYDKSPDIKWNFTKFLVDQQGNVIRRYEPTESIETIEQDLKKLL